MNPPQPPLFPLDGLGPTEVDINIHAADSDVTISCDAVVIGAGPVGLFQVFQLGLLNIKVHVIEALDYVGGQCATLYPDKPIYDIPSVLATTGRELAHNLLLQIRPFEPVFHLKQEVSKIEKRDNRQFSLFTSSGQRFITKAIFIAAGVGAFQPRKLALPGIEKFEQTQLLYAIDTPEQWVNKNLVIVGGEDTALECVLHCATLCASNAAQKPASVTLVHRRDVFQADPALVAKIQSLHQSGALHIVTGQITDYTASGDLLKEVIVTQTSAQSKTIATDTLFVFLGLSPKLGSITNWGLDLEKKQIPVNTENFETSIAGIFAIGDINTYPGKQKLILCGFHECVLAAYGGAALIYPEKKAQLEYTTTSSRLHKLLGVTKKITKNLTQPLFSLNNNESPSSATETVTPPPEPVATTSTSKLTDPLGPSDNSPITVQLTSENDEPQTLPEESKNNANSDLVTTQIDVLSNDTVEVVFEAQATQPTPPPARPEVKQTEATDIEGDVEILLNPKSTATTLSDQPLLTPNTDIALDLNLDLAHTPEVEYEISHLSQNGALELDLNLDMAYDPNESGAPPVHSELEQTPSQEIKKE